MGYRGHTYPGWSPTSSMGSVDSPLPRGPQMTESTPEAIKKKKQKTFGSHFPKSCMVSHLRIRQRKPSTNTVTTTHLSLTFNESMPNSYRKANNYCVITSQPNPRKSPWAEMGIEMRLGSACDIFNYGAMVKGAVWDVYRMRRVDCQGDDTTEKRVV